MNDAHLLHVTKLRRVLAHAFEHVPYYQDLGVVPPTTGAEILGTLESITPVNKLDIQSDWV